MSETRTHSTRGCGDAGDSGASGPPQPQRSSSPSARGGRRQWKRGCGSRPGTQSGWRAPPPLGLRSIAPSGLARQAALATVILVPIPNSRRDSATSPWTCAKKKGPATRTQRARISGPRYSTARNPAARPDVGGEMCREAKCPSCSAPLRCCRPDVGGELTTGRNPTFRYCCCVGDSALKDCVF